LAPGDTDPTPLCGRQIWALMVAAVRELLWGLRAVSGEVDRWRVRARCMPDAPLRHEALDSIARKRAHADGAALFWTLPRRRHPRLLVLLVAYQSAWDYLDGVSERGAGERGDGGGDNDAGGGRDAGGGNGDDRDGGEANGRRLHRALVEALDPSAALSDHYRENPSRQDGGYLWALATGAREACASLPSYAPVRGPMLAEAARCAVQSLNHDPDPARREAKLRAWAGRESQDWPGASWFERSAAASASLVPHVLLALAAEPACDVDEVARVRAAYLPWVSLATAMLDSYADLEEDRASGEHSYIAHYRERERAVARLEEIVACAARAARGLRRGPRHAVLVACAVTMYLSKDSVRTQLVRGETARLVRAGGSLTRLLAPVLRIWRVLYAQRGA
jgi:tetraprenyl-beta-curcumene synthase